MYCPSVGRMICVVWYEKHYLKIMCGIKVGQFYHRYYSLGLEMESFGNRYEEGRFSHILVEPQIKFNQE